MCVKCNIQEKTLSQGIKVLTIKMYSITNFDLYFQIIKKKAEYVFKMILKSKLA